MKRFDDSTKKLIKNIAALVTSALVLIAATVAWFASGSKADVQTINAKLVNTNFNITYFEMKSDYVTGVLQSATVGGSSPGFTFDSAKTVDWKMTDSDDAENTKWETATAFNIDSLEPGSFQSFRIHLQASATATLLPTLIASGATWTGTVADADKKTVYENVYVHAVVVQTSTDPNTNQPVYTPRGAVCCSLSDMLNGSGSFSMRLTANNTIVTGSYDVLLDIGIPGGSVTTVNGQTSSTDYLRNAHDALRQIGATFTLNSVTVE